MKVSKEEEEETWAAQAWSWGAGTDGQLGNGVAADLHIPQPIPNFPPVSQVACGGAHAIALTRDGKVLTWGRGTSGQLGHGELENCFKPKPVKFFESLTVSYVSAGWNHSGFVTDTGHLFMCGDGSFGQLGKGDNNSHAYPSEVLFFASKFVKQIACGMRHSLVLVKGSSGNCVYGFGSGRRRQVGRHLSGSKRSTNFPDVVQGLNNSEIVSIHANGDHSAALSADGKLYVWGRGFGSSSDNHVPQILPSSMIISKLALGWNHALVLADSEVYMVGGNRHGLLSGSQADPVNNTAHSSSSRSSDEATLKLEKIQASSLDGQKMVSIGAGSEHSALVTENGVVMTWGWGEHGQLGLDDTSDQTYPQVVHVGNNDGSYCSSQLTVFCGSGFTIVVKLDQ